MACSEEDHSIVSDAVDVRDDTWPEAFDCSSDDYDDRYVFDEDYETREKLGYIEKDEYWASLHALLEEVLERHGAAGSKLREAIARIIEIAKSDKSLCECGGKAKSYSDSECCRRRVVRLLRERGFDATLYTSSWENVYGLDGSHEYIELMARTANRKKPIRLVIELYFREEFHMSKGCHQEYRSLIYKLPETYIGSRDYLNAMVCIGCDATKRYMREKNMHMGAWRMRGFMQMKWSDMSASASVELEPLVFASSQRFDKLSFVSPIASYLSESTLSTSGSVDRSDLV